MTTTFNRIGMAVDSGKFDMKRELAASLDESRYMAEQLGLYVEGRPFDSVLKAVSAQLWENVADYEPKEAQ